MTNLFAQFKLLVILTIGAIFLAACGSSAVSKSDTGEAKPAPKAATHGTSVGQIAPDFELAKFDGGNIGSKDLSGNPAVLVFWTAWCPSCKEEAPHINQLAAEFEPKGVKVIGINIGESDARVAEGIKSFGIKYTVAKDRDTSVSRNYRVMGTPTVVFLDQKGVVQYFGNELPRDYANRLNRIIGG